MPLVENNWFKTNISKRLIDKKSRIETTFCSYSFTSTNFMDAAIEVAHKIKKYDLYLGLSGGADSDFVCHLLVQQNIKFTPMIVVTPGNKLETSYAFHTCRKFDLKPIIFELSENEVLKIFYERIYNTINGMGIYWAQNLVCQDYVKNIGGKFLSGVNCIGHDEPFEGTKYINDRKVYVCMYEFDFYSDVLYDENFEIPFFLYTPRIAYESIKGLNNYDEAETKWKLFEIIDFRPKLQYQYSQKFEIMLHKLLSKNNLKIQDIWRNEDKKELMKKLLDFENKYTI